MEQTLQREDDEDVVVHSSHPYLVVYGGEEKGKRYELSDTPIEVGRSPKVDITIDDREVSKCHCAVSFHRGYVIVEDCGSTNGTFVNGERTKRKELLADAVVQVGHTVMKIEYKGDAELEYEDELIHRATTDSLSGIPNRRYFELRAREEIAYAHRSNTPIGMIMADIDHFKEVNDTHGHQAGDTVIKELCRIMKAQVRREDLLGRYGGEEFVMLLRGTSSPKSALGFCERLRERVEKHAFVHDEITMHITISIGLCYQSGERIQSLQHLIYKADEALYSAKQNGRNRVELSVG
jgi:diguanylate cyclase (GGDEF)-like protein